MSFWTDVRYPLLGNVVDGPMGAAGGLAYSRNTQQGANSMADANSGTGPWAYPGAPAPYHSTLPSQNLAGQTQQTLGGINLDRSGLDKFQAEAMRNGPSAWAGMAKADQNRIASQAQSGAAAQAQGQTAQASNNLAMRGGLDSGARERLATAGGQNYMNMSQHINDTNAGNQNQIGMNDETNRIQQLSMVPGMQVQSLQPDLQKAQMQGQAQMFDIGNQMKDASQQNQYNLGVYGNQMAGWAAGKQADETAKPSPGLFGGSGFLGLGPKQS